MSVEHYYNTESELQFEGDWYLYEPAVDNLVLALEQGKINYATIKKIYADLNRENAFAHNNGDHKKIQASFYAIAKIKPFHDSMLILHQQRKQEGHIEEIDLGDDTVH